MVFVFQRSIIGEFTSTKYRISLEWFLRSALKKNSIEFICSGDFLKGFLIKFDGKLLIPPLKLFRTPMMYSLWKSLNHQLTKYIIWKIRVAWPTAFNFVVEKECFAGVFCTSAFEKSHFSNEIGMKTYDFLKIELVYELIQKKTD